MDFTNVFALLSLSSIIEATRNIYQDRECLFAHNKLRALHIGTAPLQWDVGLAAGCADYAKELAATGRWEHSTGTGYGENLHMATGGWKPQTCAAGVRSWYKEIELYDYKRPGFSKATGHFTQLVWKATTRVGAGIAYNPDTRTTIICARYVSPGNYRSRFRTNVLQRKDRAKTVPPVSDLIPSGGGKFLSRGPVPKKPAVACRDRLASNICKKPYFYKLCSKGSIQLLCMKTCNAC